MMLVKTFCVLFTGCHAVMMDTTERKYFDDYVYYPEVNGWLKLHREAAEWHEARVTCHLEEALLATNWSAEIISIVNELQSSGNQSFEALHSGAELSMAVTEYGTYSYLEGFIHFYDHLRSSSDILFMRTRQNIYFSSTPTLSAISSLFIRFIIESFNLSISFSDFLFLSHLKPLKTRIIIFRAISMVW